MINKHTNNIIKTHRKYINNTPPRFNLTNEPITSFKIWLNQAYKEKISDPTAICLTTINHYNQPHQRLVLFKKINKNKNI